MGRIKIDLPDHFPFSTTIPVRITDINYGGHLGNDKVLTLLHEARVRFLQHYNYTELDFAGVGLIMSDVAIEFKQEIFYGDTLKAYVTIADFSRVGFDVVYKLVKNSEETVAALAKTGMVCYDYASKKITAVPTEAKSRITPSA